MSVLRRAYVEVEPDISGFDTSLREKFARADPGGKAGKQIGGQLNRALKRVDIDPIDIRGNPREVLAAIALTEARLRALSNNASTVEIKVKSERGLQEIGRFRKQLGEVGPEAAEGFAAKFGQRLGPLLSALPISGPLGTAAAAAGVAAAPLLGAALAGGIIGGIGIGGVVGGFVLAAKDPRVIEAADALGNQLQTRLYRAAGSFVKPAIDGLAKVQRALDGIDLEGIFADAANYAAPLTDGLTSAISDIGKALADLVAHAGPDVRAISDGIALVGRTLATGLSSLSDNSRESAAALDTVFKVIGSTISVTFGLVNALTELYGIGQKIGADTGLQLVLKLTGSEMKKTGDAARYTGSGTFGMSQSMIEAAASAAKLAQEEKTLKVAQDAVKAAQDDLTATLDGLGGKTTMAARLSDALRTAMDGLYGATIRNADANASYESSWDDLSASVKNNGRSLDIHTGAGRANRQSLQGLLQSSNELYLSEINSGVALGKATEKHRERTTAVREEARRVGLNKAATDDLIGTYGRIPPKKTTDLVLGKVHDIVKQLENLYIVQRALAEGIPIASARAAVKEKGGPAKQFGGYAAGGLFTGQLPGPPSSVDNLQGRGPGGRSFGLAGGEFIINAAQTAKHRTTLEAINAGLDGFASGGYFPPVDTSTRLPMTASMRHLYVMSRKEAESKVAGAIPSTGSTSDAIVAAARALVPAIRVLSKDRPGARTLSGNVSYHSLGRAVDFEPSEKLARLWNERYKARTKELISPYQQYNIHNGQRHAYTGAIWNQHNFAGGNAHDHIAMAGGGVIGEPVYGVGRSGRSYSFGENGPETVTPGLGGGGVEDLLRLILSAVQGTGGDVAAALTSATRRTLQTSRSRGLPTIAGAP